MKFSDVLVPIQATLITLKAVAVISWSWWIVLLPLEFITVEIVLVIGLLFLIAASKDKNV